jgi:hypothetical protein
MIPYDPPRRTADVYVFCLHQSVPVTNENVADPRCWSFWVVATSAIDEELEGQASVGISTLNQLAEPIGWSDVKAAVERVAATAKARDGR